TDDLLSKASSRTTKAQLSCFWSKYDQNGQKLLLDFGQ
ncbi:MAG: hypothetical protein ACJAZF_004755, partial [Granulosicoccus sp.]